MFQPLLAAILAAAVTVAEGGLVFQPALSPDGKQVAYAAEESGVVSIYVAPSDASSPRVKVGTIGTGARAHRLASHALQHAPWSPDGKSLIYLAPAADARSESLFLASLEEAGKVRPIGPTTGLVENAAFTPGGEVAFTHRDRLSSRDLFVYTASVTSSAAPSQVGKLSDGTAAVDLAPSPDGRFLALLCLYSPDDQEPEKRARQVRIIDLHSARATAVEFTDAANFLTWSADAQQLYFVDQKTHELHAIPAGQSAVEPAIGKGIVSVVEVGGTLLAVDRKGDVQALNPEAGAAARPLVRGFVPVSAAGGKVAFVRLGSLGAAIVVTDGTPAAIQSGDLGLPRPEAGEPPSPPSPPSGGAPEKTPGAAPSSGQTGTDKTSAG